MKKKRNKGVEKTPSLKDNFSNDFLFRATEIHDNKLRFLMLFADMQRVFFADISKNHTFTDNDIENLESDLCKLQEFITTA